MKKLYIQTDVSNMLCFLVPGSAAIVPQDDQSAPKAIRSRLPRMIST